MRRGAAAGVDVADDQVEGAVRAARDRHLAGVAGTDPDPGAGASGSSPAYQVHEGGVDLDHLLGRARAGSPAT